MEAKQQIGKMEKIRKVVYLWITLSLTILCNKFKEKETNSERKEVKKELQLIVNYV